MRMVLSTLDIVTLIGLVIIVSICFTLFVFLVIDFITTFKKGLAQKKISEEVKEVYDYFSEQDKKLD